MARGSKGRWPHPPVSGGSVTPLPLHVCICRCILTGMACRAPAWWPDGGQGAGTQHQKLQWRPQLLPARCAQRARTCRWPRAVPQPVPGAPLLPGCCSDASCQGAPPDGVTECVCVRVCACTCSRTRARVSSPTCACPRLRAHAPGRVRARAPHVRACAPDCVHVPPDVCVHVLPDVCVYVLPDVCVHVPPVACACSRTCACPRCACACSLSCVRVCSPMCACVCCLKAAFR